LRNISGSRPDGFTVPSSTVHDGFADCLPAQVALQNALGQIDPRHFYRRTVAEYDYCIDVGFADHFNQTVMPIRNVDMTPVNALHLHIFEQACENHGSFSRFRGTFPSTISSSLVVPFPSYPCA
jgi:hypothetical protein